MGKQKQDLRAQAISMYKDIYKFAFKCTKDGQAAQDIAQTVMETIIRKIQQLKKPEALKGWVMQIASNEIKTYFRTLQRYEKKVISDSDDGSIDLNNIQDLQADILEGLVDQESQRFAIQALLKVDEKYQEVLRLALIGDQPLIKVAEILNLNYNTVRTRYARGLTALKSEFLKIEDGHCHEK